MSYLIFVAMKKQNAFTLRKIRNQNACRDMAEKIRGYEFEEEAADEVLAGASLESIALMAMGFCDDEHGFVSGTAITALGNIVGPDLSHALAMILTEGHSTVTAHVLEQTAEAILSEKEDVAV